MQTRLNIFIVFLLDGIISGGRMDGDQKVHEKCEEILGRLVSTARAGEKIETAQQTNL